MASERMKMLAGEPYDPADPELVEARRQARLRLQRYNGSLELPQEARLELLRDLIPHLGRKAWIEPPFFCDYGTQLHLGEGVFLNTGCVILDVAPVRIGSGTLLGPAVQVYTATHPLRASERRRGLESACPIEIGEDVWVGGGAILCPGVRIGSRAVLGAGSVVTRDIPEGVLAAGNPARVLRKLEA